MKHIMRSILVLSFGFALYQAAGTEPIPIESFFKLPQYAETKISPDGKYLAALSPFKGRQNLFVMNLENRTGQPVSGMDTRDVVWFSWISNKRLILRTGTLAEQAENFRGDGLYAVDRDGTYARQLSAGIDKGREGSFRAVYRPLYFVRALPGESDEIIVQEWVFDHMKGRAGALYRLNTRDGRRTSITSGKPDSADYENRLVDSGGIPRVFFAQKEGKNSLYYQSGSDSPWVKLGEFPTTVSACA
jgi:Tol biopolymer transport system component